MSIEENLKSYILTKFRSLREFAGIIDIPVSTLDSIFKRGIENSVVTNVMKICNELKINMDALTEGRIEPVKTIQRSDLDFFLEALHKRPELRILFDKTYKSTSEDVEQVIRIVDAIRGENKSE